MVNLLSVVTVLSIVTSVAEDDCSQENDVVFLQTALTTEQSRFATQAVQVPSLLELKAEHLAQNGSSSSVMVMVVVILVMLFLIPLIVYSLSDTSSSGSGHKLLEGDGTYRQAGPSRSAAGHTHTVCLSFFPWRRVWRDDACCIIDARW